MLFRFSCFLAVMALFLVPTSSAVAQDASDMPWIVTRKADNRVLRNLVSKDDIEASRAGDEEGSDKAFAGKQNDQKSAPPATTVSKNATKTASKPSAAAKPAVPAVAIPATVGSIGKLTFDISDKQIVIFIPTDTVVTDTRYINLDDPRRLAVDLMGVWTYNGSMVYRFDTGAAEKGVMGKHDDYLRVVLYLTEAPVAAEIVPSFQLVEGGLRVTVPVTP